MPKAEKGSVKDLANRMKAKGLQKLKFYCQICEKQCRDANGFKCHIAGDSHLRQMKIFSDNAGGILDQYSKEFEQNYIQTLKMRHSTKQVNANNVYQELIADKQHIHMNATHWTTLSEFVQYLGKSGKCAVEETERGWMIAYIERDVSILARKEAHQRREQADRAAEQAMTDRMELQRKEAAKALDKVGASLQVEPSKLERSEQDKPIKVAGIGFGAAAKKNKKAAVAALGFEDNGDDQEEEGDAAGPPKPPPIDNKLLQPKKRPLQQEARPRDDKRPKISSKDEPKKSDKVSTSKGEDASWLYKNIVVRVITKDLAGGKYFRKKAVVDRLVDDFTAEVEILRDGHGADGAGDILRIDQHELETVIPKSTDKQQKVRILNGRYRGYKARIEYLDKKAYQADLKITGDNDKTGKRLRKVPYEDFSQIA
ncbi:MAG: hypothetical protein SGILL_008743 [Bacillariaceae sp.]